MLALKFHVYVVVDQADNKDNFFRQFKNGPCSTVEYFDQKKTLKIFSTGCQNLSENLIYFGKVYANRKFIFPHKDELAEMKF